jgi:hypothetical protein
MKRPRRPLHQPDPLVAAAESMPKRRRCGARNKHSYGPYKIQRFPKAPRAPRPPSDFLGKAQPAYVHRIAEAIRDGGRVGIVYRDAYGQLTKRHVRPRAWIEAGDLFVAHYELRGADRHFRVGRCLDCQCSPVDPPGPGNSPDEPPPAKNL